MYKQNQRVDEEYKIKYGGEWRDLKKEIKIEIDKDLTTRMVRRGQQVDLRVASKDGESKRIVRSMKEIGLVFQQDRSKECFTKVYTILNEDFRIRFGYVSDTNGL